MNKKVQEIYDQVPVGGVFRRVHSARVAEVAEVVWTGEDSAGIPHVRYNIFYIRHDRRESEGSRMLAAATFLEMYQPIDSAAVA